MKLKKLGFTKHAVNVRLVQKGVYAVSGPGSKKFMFDRAWEQTPYRNKIMRKVLGEKHYKSIKEKMFDSRIAGTIGGNKKIYIHLDNARSIKRDTGRNIRGLIQHEKFHKIPIIGRSETLAYAWGGLTHKKGRLDPGMAIRELGRFYKTRPVRAIFEPVVVGSGVVAVLPEKSTGKITPQS